MKSSKNMSLNGTKAMILAAGLGTRLRPLTLKTPKALLLLDGRPLIVYSLLLLKKYGITDVLINLHYLGEHIQNELGDGSRWEMNISYSWEEKLLGTGGGIKKAQSFFGDKDFLVINSDILIDLDLKKLFSFHLSLHQEKKSVATMVVRKQSESADFTSLYLDRSKKITSIGEKNSSKENIPVMYTGVQILGPDLLHYLPNDQESCLIRQGYQAAIHDGQRVSGFLYEGYWNDLGTLDRYRQAESDIKNKSILSYLNSASR